MEVPFTSFVKSTQQKLHLELGSLTSSQAVNSPVSQFELLQLAAEGAAVLPFHTNSIGRDGKCFIAQKDKRVTVKCKLHSVQKLLYYAAKTISPICKHLHRQHVDTKLAKNPK